MMPLDSPESLHRIVAARAPDQGLPIEHLLLRLRPINRALKMAAEFRAASARLMQPDIRQASITEQHVQRLFAEADGLVEGGRQFSCDLELTAGEARQEDRLRNVARAQGLLLPLDALVQQLQLSAFEIQAMLLCAAPQLLGAYQRIYAYVHDDLNRLGPSLELISRLPACDVAGQLANREALAPHGRLCRLGILRIESEPANPLHREYALDASAFDALTRHGPDWARLYRDADLVDTDDALALDLFPDKAGLARIVHLLEDDQPYVIGLWGRQHYGGADAAAALAAAAGRMLRRLPTSPVVDAAGLARFLRTAEALDALVWIDTDCLRHTEDTDRLASQLACSSSAIVCTGSEPWRPLALLSRRPFVDLALRAPGRLERSRMWQATAPDADPETCLTLAERYQFSPGAMRAASVAASLSQRARVDGRQVELAEALPESCRTISLRRGSQYARTIMPRRQPEDLILPGDLHRRVVEVATFYRSVSKVDEGWGFGRLLTGGGVKVLMTGDSGTGKTAAAEVIAGQVDRNQPMLKVHLASVVSKWVGETEKNLDAVFQHAEESHAVLFFDEADSLFAKRGEVERGADRYANLEVGFLLQRLEDFAGLVILASNHKDQIDEAFMRRFQVVLHFPRPTPAERLRLWHMALPPEAPKTADIDFEVLQKLDLTGAGIVNAARMAALLAAQERDARIGMAHLIPAVARQFQHEARLLPTTQLGRYVELIGSSS
ncbi:ATP-binding protein [Mesorhizobium muleiense]|uniref:AAA family ATPase n=1 Tax=Mesorhizobium muleiense TaxID=1004279 RepID=UPI003AFB50F8